MDRGDEVGALRKENEALRGALRLLSEVANLARAAEDPDATAYAILTGVTAGVGLGMNCAMLFERDPESPEVLVGRAAIGPSTAAEADRIWRSIEAEQPTLETLYEAGLRRRRERSALDLAVRGARVDLRRDHALSHALERVVYAESGDDLDGLVHPPTMLAAPMRGREGLRGVLVADNRFTRRVPDSVHRLVFEMVADHAGRALFSAERFARVAAEARVDALTGLDTRRVGLASLEHAVGVALAEGRGVALLVLDVDHFKHVNDTYGHPVGDAVLAEVAHRVRSALRRGERAFRYGGEEVVVIVEDGTIASAFETGERLRAAVASGPIETPRGDAITITCSVGVAAAPPSAADPVVLLRAADDALLRAKRRGRDRVERSDELDAIEP
ncbi:MAG: GGDEF domain-containing protein [Sandaracinus sp.]|nr:GGDEF domain-containing protein [Sandaracinus sp.]MCB9619903.1 GGDEF domain-containing protein [Sandaracinus sp.]